MRCGKASESDASLHRTVELVGGVRISVALGERATELIKAIGELQRGRMTRRQLRAAGVSPSAVDRQVRSGRLEYVHHGVYGLPHTWDIPLAAETAALLACGEGAALSHHSAIILWGLRPGEARPIHVTIPGHRGFPNPSGVKVHRSRILKPSDIRIHDGLPVTAPARTILDVAATLPDRDVERVLYEAMFARRLVTAGEIDDILRRAGGHPGRSRLARVAGAGAPLSDTGSPPAEKLLRMIRGADLPEPQTEVPVLGYRLDLYWPELNLAVEVDAYGTHGSPARFEADRRRDARLLTEMGIVVIRITRAMIERQPQEALALVARAIGQREAAVRSSRSRSR